MSWLEVLALFPLVYNGPMSDLQEPLSKATTFLRCFAVTAAILLAFFVTQSAALWLMAALVLAAALLAGYLAQGRVWTSFLGTYAGVFLPWLLMLDRDPFVLLAFAIYTAISFPVILAAVFAGAILRRVRESKRTQQSSNSD